MDKESTVTILNVDDNEAGRYAITRILKKAGFSVTEAATGRDALAKAQANPDLILLDVNLPDISGFEVCHRIKADPGTYHIPVLHISASRLDDDAKVTGLESGADGYLTQPVDPRVLVSTVRALLRIRSAEDSLREALAEKELLMREIHHRVKNNLAIIDALLSMQAGTVHDDKTLAIITDVQARIAFMAQVHKSLYQSENISMLQFNRFLESVASRLVELPGRSYPIKFRVDGGDFRIGSELAVPAGLIVNELVTNAIKYAFPDGHPPPARAGEPCRISVAIRHDENAGYTIVVSDNGTGLPPGFDISSARTLGLRLVSVLATRQLKGSVDINTARGTEFVVKFPNPKKTMYSL